MKVRWKSGPSPSEPPTRWPGKSSSTWPSDRTMRPAFRAAAGLLYFLAAAGAQPAVPPDLLDGVEARCLGPANMSGRVTSLAVFESRPAIQYVAAASGGVWKTINNGITWTPMFD